MINAKKVKYTLLFDTKITSRNIILDVILASSNETIYMTVDYLTLFKTSSIDLLDTELVMY